MQATVAVNIIWIKTISICIFLQSINQYKLKIVKLNVINNFTPWYWKYFCFLLYLSDSTSHTSIFIDLPISSDCCKWYKPETWFIFLLVGTGIFLVLFYIYPTVPHAPAFLYSFLFPVTVEKGIGPKGYSYVYSLVLEFFLCSSKDRTTKGTYVTVHEIHHTAITKIFGLFKLLFCDSQLVSRNWKEKQNIKAYSAWQK